MKFIILTLLLASWLSAAQVNLAVSNFEAQGLGSEEALIIGDRLRVELIKTGSFRVMERSMMDELLKEQGFQQSGACNNSECQVEVGRLLGVERVVVGSIGKLGNMFSISIRMLNVETGEILCAFSEDHEGAIEGLIRGPVSKLAVRLATFQSKQGSQNNTGSLNGTLEGVASVETSSSSLEASSSSVSRVRSGWGGRNFSTQRQSSPPSLVQPAPTLGKATSSSSGAVVTQIPKDQTVQTPKAVSDSAKGNPFKLYVGLQVPYLLVDGQIGEDQNMLRATQTREPSAEPVVGVVYDFGKAELGWGVYGRVRADMALVAIGWEGWYTDILGAVVEGDGTDNYLWTIVSAGIAIKRIMSNSEIYASLLWSPMSFSPEDGSFMADNGGLEFGYDWGKKWGISARTSILYTTIPVGQDLRESSLFASADLGVFLRF